MNKQTIRKESYTFVDNNDYKIERHEITLETKKPNGFSDIDKGHYVFVLTINETGQHIKVITAKDVSNTDIIEFLESEYEKVTHSHG